MSYSFCTEYWIHIHQSSTYVFLLDPHNLVSRKSFPQVCNFHYCCPMAANNVNTHLAFEYKLWLNFFSTKNFIIENIWCKTIGTILTHRCCTAIFWAAVTWFCWRIIRFSFYGTGFVIGWLILIKYSEMTFSGWH